MASLGKDTRGPDSNDSRSRNQVPWEELWQHPETQYQHPRHQRATQLLSKGYRQLTTARGVQGVVLLVWHHTQTTMAIPAVWLSYDSYNSGEEIAGLWSKYLRRWLRVLRTFRSVYSKTSKLSLLVSYVVEEFKATQVRAVSTLLLLEDSKDMAAVTLNEGRKWRLRKQIWKEWCTGNIKKSLEQCVKDAWV